MQKENELVVGLDAGSNSIGWAVVEMNDEKLERIHGIGSRIIPMGDEKKEFEQGAKITKNAVRRQKRSMRRNHQRYKLRRSNLVQVLKLIGAWPEGLGERIGPDAPESHIHVIDEPRWRSYPCRPNNASIMRISYTPPILVLLLLTAPLLKAQTLQVGDLTPPLGVPFQVYSADYQPPGPGGTGLTWDFSSLPETEGWETSFTDATENASTASYPEANLAELLGGDFYDFYGYTAEGIDYYGMASVSANALMQFQDPRRILSFPCSYASSWQDNFGGQWTSSTGWPVDSYGNTSCTADAVGTLIMPYGAVENVLRVITTWNDSDSFAGTGYINYHVEQQDYYKPGIPRPLLSFTSQTGGGTATSESLDYTSGSWLADPALLIHEAVSNAIGMEVMPNPAQDQVSLVFSSPGGMMELSVIDATGRTVRNMKLDRQPLGIARQDLDLNGIPPGLYTIQLTAANGQRGMKKLVVE